MMHLHAGQGMRARKGVARLRVFFRSYESGGLPLHAANRTKLCWALDLQMQQDPNMTKEVGIGHERSEQTTVVMDQKHPNKRTPSASERRVDTLSLNQRTPARLSPPQASAAAVSTVSSTSRTGEKPASSALDWGGVSESIRIRIYPTNSLYKVPSLSNLQVLHFDAELQQFLTCAPHSLPCA